MNAAVTPTCFLKCIASWLFWNGAVPLFAIAATFPVRSCIASGSLEVLLSFGSGGKDLGPRDCRASCSDRFGFQPGYNASCKDSFTGRSRMPASMHRSDRKTWPIQTFRVLLGGLVAPFVSSVLSTVITVVPRTRIGETVFGRNASIRAVTSDALFDINPSVYGPAARNWFRAAEGVADEGPKRKVS